MQVGGVVEAVSDESRFEGYDGLSPRKGVADGREECKGNHRWN